jgi:hypothetical protein
MNMNEQMKQAAEAAHPTWRKEVADAFTYPGSAVIDLQQKAFIAGAEWMASAAPRWVKASERLPKARGPYFVKVVHKGDLKHVTKDVTIKTTWIMGDNEQARVSSDGEYILLEWLDESGAAPVGEAPQKMGIGKLRDLLHAYDFEEISISKFLEEINKHFLGGEKYEPSNSNTDEAPVASHSVCGNKSVEQFTPPDHGEECWPMGAETYTRKEVAYLLYTQRAMISNDLKAHCGHDLTPGMYQILKQPRTPQY